MWLVFFNNNQGPIIVPGFIVQPREMSTSVGRIGPIRLIRRVGTFTDPVGESLAFILYKHAFQVLNGPGERGVFGLGEGRIAFKQLGGVAPGEIQQSRIA